MTINRKPTGKATSTPAGIVCGTMTAATITILGVLIIAKLIEQEIIQWENAGYGALVVLLLSSWVGAATAAAKIKRQRVMVCITVGMLYFIVLVVIVALFFGGRYSGVGETALLIFGGSILGCLRGYGRKCVRMQRKTGRYCR